MLSLFGELFMSTLRTKFFANDVLSGVK